MSDSQNIIEVVEKIYKVNPKDRTRRKNHIWARAAFYVEMRKNHYSLHHIGEQMNRDHATVMHGLKLHNDLFGRDKHYMAYYNRFLRAMGYEVQDEPIKPIEEYKEFTTGQEALIELIKQVPESQCESVYVKLEAIVRMSKVTHKIK